ncbi:oligosaccharide flippase family protein [Candidatus Fermentibacteria bacterium]|nr:oligosaccharide flippase family protein [Candidatus Fermentibacteria bacterium]
MIWRRVFPRNLPDVIIPLHRDTVTLLVARAAGPAVTVILLALLARQRGAEEVGLYGLAAAVFSLLEAASSLGFRHLLPREMARVEDRALLGSAAVACLGVGTLLALIAGAMAVCLTVGQTSRVLVLVALAIPIAALAVPEEGYWIGVQRSGRLAATLLVEQAARLLAGLALLRGNAPVEALVGLLGLGRAVAVVLAIPPQGFGFRRANRHTLRALARQVPVFLGLEAMFQLYWRVDVLLLSALASLAEVGFYVAAFRIFSTLLLVPQSYGQILLPRMMKPGGERLLRRGIADTLAMGIALGLAAGAGASVAVRFLYGAGFDRAASVLVVLAFGMVLASVDQAQGRALVARNRQGRDLAVLSVATVVNVWLNIILIPRYGAMGAAAATLLSLAVSVGGHATALRTK